MCSNLVICPPLCKCDVTGEAGSTGAGQSLTTGAGAAAGRPGLNGLNADG